MSNNHLSIAEKKDYTLHVSLVITIFKGSPEQVTVILGINPSITRNKGDTIPKTTMVHKNSLWELESGVEPINSLFDEHVSALENQIRPVRGKFSLLPTDSYIELSCYVSNRTEFSYPAIHLSSDSLKFFTSIGAEIDVDVR